jgi:hypothetical protein
MNVYRFSKDAHTFKVVVAPDIATASKHVDFEWSTIKKIYDNVTIAQ